MAPQIQRARFALRALHRLEALRMATIEARETDVEAQADDDMQAAEDNLSQPLLGTEAEAVAADVRTSRSNSLGKKA